MSDSVRTHMKHSRSAFVLIVVLVIVGSAMLVATGLLFFAQTEAAMSTGAVEATQSRALVWSGLQAIMSRMQDQRHKVLDGDLPELEPQLVVYETATRAGVVRLLAAHDGALLGPEAGKLDLNAATLESLTATGLIDQALAERIVQHRSEHVFQSVYELLAIAGADITAERLYGEIASIDLMDQAQRPVEDVGQRIARRLEDSNARGLVDVFTVFSIEPLLQRNGTPRINLNQPWSDSMARAIEDQFGREAAEAVKTMLAEGKTFENDARIVQTLRALNVPVQDWAPILDAFTTESGRLQYGRVDINTAPYEALLGIPGVTSEHASQIVRVRDELSMEERASIAWLVTQQIIPPEDFEGLADKITTRCWTYRVRLAAGEVLLDELDGPLMNPMIVEAVIDAAGEQPRIAYWRDITLLQAAARLTLEGVAFEPAEAETESVPREVEQPPVGSAPAQTQPDNASETPETPAPAPEKGRRIGRWIAAQ